MLDYLTKELTKKERKETIKYMSQYNNLSAIIESKKLDLYPSNVTTIKDDPSTPSNQFYSETEETALKSLEIEEYELTKMKLDLVYESVKPIQKLIWDEHFIDGRTDSDTYYGHDITKRTYYREKEELIKVVAECLDIGTNSHQKCTKNAPNGTE